MKINDNVTVTDFKNGPYTIIVTDYSGDGPKEAFPMLVVPNEPYKTREEARAFIDQFEKHDPPYLGLHFEVAPLRTEDSFGTFISWRK